VAWLVAVTATQAGEESRERRFAGIDCCARPRATRTILGEIALNCKLNASNCAESTAFIES